MEIKIVVNGKLKEKIYLRRIKKYLEWISKDAKIEIIHIKDSNKNKILKKVDKLKRMNFFLYACRKTEVKCLQIHFQNLFLLTKKNWHSL